MSVKNLNILEAYLPLNSLQFVQKWTDNKALQLLVKWERKSILGNYSRKANYHQITINYNLPKELFFLTLTHEIAHMHVREKFGKRAKPHGTEWKKIFAEMIFESIDVYDTKFQPILNNYAQNPKANFFSFSPFVEYFFEDLHPNKLALNSLPKEKNFVYNNRVFKKVEKRKLKYLCQEVKTGKAYLFHPLSPVDVA